MQSITARELKSLLGHATELALLDVREHGRYGEGHPFFAVPLPYSCLEARIGALVPRAGVACVVLDDDDGIAEKAAARLLAMGYHDVRILDGGVAAWSAAGYSLFKGVNVPSKAFGEMVEHSMETPSISAQELAALEERGERLVILDGRTPAEFRKMSIPGARSCPNAELGYRLAGLATDPDTRIVINCAGRTRSIIGAQGLRSLGLGERVVALRNGTQGWSLAGLQLDHGRDPGALPEPSPREREEALIRGARMLQRLGVERIDEARLATWHAREERSIFLLDVRTLAEYRAGHVPGAVHAPGGQLAQAMDQWVGVRNARVVLCDDSLMRAAFAALWLKGMGHEVSVLGAWSNPVTGEDHRSWTLPGSQGLATCPLDEVGERLGRGATLVDVSPSMAFRAAHVEGARWSIRPRLGQLQLAPGADVIVVGRDPAVVALAATELKDLGIRDVSVAPGGPVQWRAAGLPVEESPGDPPDADCIDYLFFVHDRHDGNLAAARAYLDWETGLTAQMDAQELGVMDPRVPVLE